MRTGQDLEPEQWYMGIWEHNDGNHLAKGSGVEDQGPMDQLMNRARPQITLTRLFINVDKCNS